MLISVILVSYNTAEMTIDALDALFASTTDFDMEVVIVDNASADHSVALIKQHYPNITLIENQKNVGFGRANNQALDVIQGEYVLLLNTDAFVEPDTIQQTIDYMKNNSKCGLLGVRLIGREGDLQPSCRFFPTPLNIFAQRLGLNRYFSSIRVVDNADTDHSQTQACDWVPGCYYLLRKEVVDTVGLFDPLYFLYSEEVDHCFAIKRAGWDVIYYADTNVVHIGGESAKSVGKISNVSRQVPNLQIESELLYFRKNHGLLGVWSHILLSNIADFIQFVKDLIRLKPKQVVSFSIKRIVSYWRVYFLTNMAKTSTR